MDLNEKQSILLFLGSNSQPYNEILELTFTLYSNNYVYHLTEREIDRGDTGRQITPGGSDSSREQQTLSHELLKLKNVKGCKCNGSVLRPNMEEEWQRMPQ